VNARRNFDADAFEFCILHSFSKSDYEDLKAEFKGIFGVSISKLYKYKRYQAKIEVRIEILQEGSYGSDNSNIEEI